MMDIEKIKQMIENGETKIPKNSKAAAVKDEYKVVDGESIKIDFSRRNIDEMVKPSPDMKIGNEFILAVESNMPAEIREHLINILDKLNDLSLEARYFVNKDVESILKDSKLSGLKFTPFAKFGVDLDSDEVPTVYYERPVAATYRIAAWFAGTTKTGEMYLNTLKAFPRSVHAVWAAIAVGPMLNEKAKFIITYSPSGADNTNNVNYKEYETSRVIKIASKLDIPLYNIGTQKGIIALINYIKLIESVANKNKVKTKQGKVPLTSPTKLEVTKIPSDGPVNGETGNDTAPAEEIISEDVPTETVITETKREIF